MMKAALDGKIYEVSEEVDMTKYPKTAAYTKRTLYVKGPRGCNGMLCQRAKGDWYLMEFGASRIVSPRTRNLKEVQFSEAA